MEHLTSSDIQACLGGGRFGYVSSFCNLYLGMSEATHILQVAWKPLTVTNHIDIHQPSCQ